MCTPLISWIIPDRAKVRILSDTTTQTTRRAVIFDCLIETNSWDPQCPAVPKSRKQLLDIQVPTEISAMADPGRSGQSIFVVAPPGPAGLGSATQA